MTKERFAEIMRVGTIDDALRECYAEGFAAGVESTKPKKQSMLQKLLRLQG